MTDVDEYEAALAFLHEEAPASCLTREAVEQCPEPVQRALRNAMFDPNVSAPRIIKLLSQYVEKAPSESALRRHRTGGCRCPKES